MKDKTREFRIVRRQWVTARNSQGEPYWIIEEYRPIALFFKRWRPYKYAGLCGMATVSFETLNEAAECIANFHVGYKPEQTMDTVEKIINI